MMILTLMRAIMFSKKISNDAFSNLIAEGTTVSGGINFNGALKVQGEVTGESIICKDNEASTLIVDKTGSVSVTRVSTADAVISGKITADELFALGTLRVLKTGVVNCKTIYYNNLEIEPGAVIHGEMKHLNGKVDQSATLPNN